MTLKQVSGIGAALFGAALLWFQGAGTAAYLARGASLADALTPDAVLIVVSAALVLGAGMAYATDRSWALWIAVPAMLLNGLVLYLTLLLGAGRPAWIAGAFAQAALIIAVGGALLQGRNTPAAD